MKAGTGNSSGQTLPDSRDSLRMVRLERWRQHLNHRNAPVALLGILSVASLLLRMAWLSHPDILMFDENYYVNAARRILGITLPPDQIYANAPAGLDPNFSHPPLGKALIAIGIHLIGDTPIGWRFMAIVFGTCAIFALYWLARASGSGQWVAVGACSLMVFDPMLFIHGRIGTLEILVLTFMLVSGAFYLRGQPAMAGLVVGFAACVKLVGFFPLLVFAVLELLRHIAAPRNSTSPKSRTSQRPDRVSLRTRAGSLALASLTAVVSYLGLLYMLDQRFTQFDSPVDHTYQMLNAFEAGDLDDAIPRAAVAPSNEERAQNPLLRQEGQTLFLAPVSNPWEWLLNQEPIVFIRSSTDGDEVRSWSRLGLRTPDTLSFQAIINPAIIVLAVPALGYAAWSALGRRRNTKASLMPLAWFAGTFGGYLLSNLLRSGSYGHLYYMVIVLPGIYLALAQALAHERLRRIRPVFAIAVILGFLYYFPFKTWGGV